MPVIELSTDGQEMLVPCRDTYQRRYFLYVLGLELARVPDPPARPKLQPCVELQPCVACGRPSVNRWCSESCFVAEDGPPDEYYDRYDMDEEDEDE